MLISRSVNSVSFCSHRRSQSGAMWHFQQLLNLELSLWGLYFGDNEPYCESSLMTSSNCFMLRPRLIHRLKAFLILRYRLSCTSAEEACHEIFCGVEWTYNLTLTCFLQGIVDVISVGIGSNRSSFKSLKQFLYYVVVFLRL